MKIFERGASYVTGVARGYYLVYWGRVLQRVGYPRRGLELTEQALEIGQVDDRQLELLALNNMAAVYHATGQPRRALELFEQALPLMREVGDRAGEANTLSNMAVGLSRCWMKLVCLKMLAGIPGKIYSNTLMRCARVLLLDRPIRQRLCPPSGSR